MRARSRLKHTAAGLLGSIISRNNDVDGYWAPGLMYRDVSASPHVMDIDLLTGSTQPVSGAARIVAVLYKAFLRDALEKKGFAWEELASASARFQFNAKVADPYPGWMTGDPFVCSVTLRTLDGHVADVSAISKCEPYRWGIFSRSTRRKGIDDCVA